MPSSCSLLTAADVSGPRCYICSRHCKSELTVTVALDKLAFWKHNWQVVTTASVYAGVKVYRFWPFARTVRTLSMKLQWICSIFTLPRKRGLRYSVELCCRHRLRIVIVNSAVVNRFFGACIFCLRSEFYYATQHITFTIAAVTDYRFMVCVHETAYILHSQSTCEHKHES